jgi:hypothetical protein
MESKFRLVFLLQTSYLTSSVTHAQYVSTQLPKATPTSTASGTASPATTSTTSAVPNPGLKQPITMPYSRLFSPSGNGNVRAVLLSAQSPEQDVGVRSILSVFRDLCRIISRMRVLILAIEQVLVHMVRKSLA